MSDEKEIQDKLNEDGSVTLKGETYNAVIERLNDLESEVEEYRKGDKDKGDKDKDDKDDDLAKLARDGKKGSDEEIDLDALSQSDLFEHIIGSVRDNFGLPILTQLETLRLDAEIDRFTRDGKVTDFEEHSEAILKMAIDNPNLSIKDAYRLVAGTDKGKDSSKEDDEDDKSGEEDKKGSAKKDPLKHLPVSEKPGSGSLTPGGQGEEEPKDRKSAAAKAFGELDMGKFSKEE